MLDLRSVLVTFNICLLLNELFLAEERLLKSQEWMSLQNSESIMEIPVVSVSEFVILFQKLENTIAQEQPRNLQNWSVSKVSSWIFALFFLLRLKWSSLQSATKVHNRMRCLDGKVVSPVECNDLGTSLGYSVFVSLQGKPVTFPTV